MSGTSDWATTTHDWSTALDLEHLAALRAEGADGACAGGRRHLILEVLAYANEEAEALGRQGRATVTYHDDGAVSVADDGRGTDTRRDAAGRVVRKPVMATADVRFTDPAERPSLPDGLPRRGASAVAALSRELVHENHRVGGSWSQTYRFGVPDQELRAVEAPRTAPGSAGSGSTGPRRTGTRVTFSSDIEGPDRLEEGDLQGFPWLQITEA